MDWNHDIINLRAPAAASSFMSRPPAVDTSSLSFFYNYNYDPYQEMKHALQQAPVQHAAALVSDKSSINMMMSSYGNIDEGGAGGRDQNNKKKRLTNDQLESLESSFQEEIKLDPDRKMKLAKDLGLQPRQIAVWFQNRRARWKAKQMERLYDALKQELDVVSNEKQKLHEEVVALRAILKEQVGGKKPVVSTTGYTEMSGEETVESTSIIPSSSKPRRGGMGAGNNHLQQTAECSSYTAFNVVVDDYNTAIPPYWAPAIPPSYP